MSNILKRRNKVNIFVEQIFISPTNHISQQFTKAPLKQVQKIVKIIHSKAYNFEVYYNQLDAWLQIDYPERQNKPMIIVTQAGFGAKLLVSKWIQMNEEKQKKNTYQDMFIHHFPRATGVSPFYGYCIYRILYQFRKNLDVKEKIELSDERLRQFFPYWLKVCSDMIKTQIVNTQKIVLILPEIEKFIDNKQQDVTGDFWLPKTFPERVKVLLTVTEGSDYHKYFRSMGCSMIKMKFEKETLLRLIKVKFERVQLLDNESIQRIREQVESMRKETIQDQDLLITFQNILLPYSTTNLVPLEFKQEIISLYRTIDLDFCQQSPTSFDLLKYYIKQFENKIVPVDRFYKIFFILMISNKGLTEREILDLVGIQQGQWNVMFTVFRGYINKFEELYNITSKNFFKAIYEIDEEKHLFQSDDLHNEIAKYITNLPHQSLRNLEEITFNYYQSKNLLLLKMSMDNLEKFLLLFSPNSSYLLYMYWDILKIPKGMFDPVIEYSKSFEIFEQRNKPSCEALFLIFLQFSRFFRELGYFEDSGTPDFRHPPIVGHFDVKHIGLYPQVKKMDMYWGEYIFQEQKNQQLQQKQRQHLEYELNMEEYDMASYKEQKTMMRPKRPTDIVIEKTRQKLSILKKWENYNIDIPLGRKMFRKHFENILKEMNKGIAEKQRENQEQNKRPQKEDSYDEQELEELHQREMRGVTKEDFYIEDTRSSKEIIFLQSLIQNTSSIVIQEPKKIKVKFYFYKRF